MPTQPAVRRGALRPRGLVALLLTLLAVGLGVDVLVVHQTTVAETAAYATYLLLAVLLPGTLVHKALRGPQETWLADLALGAATGLSLELVAWAAFSLVHQQGLLRLWPVLTLPLLGWRRVRARLLAPPTQPWHPGVAAATTVAVVLVGAHIVRIYFRPYPLMPSAEPYYQDTVWHLGLAWEAQRSFPLGTPQVVGDGNLRYHWFADAHVGIGALISHVNVVTVMMRLWVLPVAALTVLLTAALAQRLSGRAWAGALAALVVVPAGTFQFWAGNSWILDHFSALSPSQIFAMPLTLLVLHALTDVVRRGRAVRGADPVADAQVPGVPATGALVVAGIGLVACMGAKASALPTLVGGLVITTVAAVVLRRQRRILLTLTAFTAGLAAVGLTFVAGGDAGSTYQLFSNYSLLPFYRNLVTTTADLTTPVLGGLFGSPGPGPLLFVGLTFVTLIASLRALPFLLAAFRPRLRTDLSAWLVSGTCAAAFGPFFLVSHAGYSQYYFLFGVVPAGCALLAWVVADVIEGHRGRALLAVGSGVVTGPVAAWLTMRAAHQPDPGSRRQWTATLEAFVLEVSVALAVLALAVVVARRGRSGRAAAVAAVALGAVIGPVIASGPAQEVASTVTRPLSVPEARRAAAEGARAARAQAAGGSARPGRVNPQSPVVLRAETEAALWIQQHVPLRALAATNAQCLYGSTMSCDGQRWWVSGLGGRRVLLSGWAYTPRGAHTSFYDPALFVLNQQTFAYPNPDLVAQLRAKGVTWLVAEDLPGLTVSADLGRYGTLRYANAFVRIYQLTG